MVNINIMQSSILITTLGHSWQLILELVGFTNPDDYGFYKYHSGFEKINNIRTINKIKPVKEIWVISTDDKRTINSIKTAKGWLNENVKKIKMKSFILKGISDLTKDEHCRQMGNLIYQVVLAGKKYVNGGQLLLSLSGGRKTMSADMQEAGNIFGFDAMIHIIDDGNIPQEFKNLKTIDTKFSRHFIPIVAFGKRDASKIIYFEQDILENQKYDIPLNEENIYLEPDTELYNEIEGRRNKSRNIAFNFYQKIYQKEPASNFYSLYFLEPDKIQVLKNKKIVIEDYNLIKKLPKAELHCHLGGIADTKEMVEIAYSNLEKVNFYRRKYKKYDDWLKIIRENLSKNELSKITEMVSNPKELVLNCFKEIPEPYSLAGFLIQFKDYEKLLDELIFGKYLNSEDYKNIGIEKYSKLGDLQGSSLLQSRESLASACNILKRKAKEHNVKYLELRCSPHNYTKGGLSIDEVVDVLVRNLESDVTVFKLIFIATRHKKISEINEIVNYVLNKNDKKFMEFFVGFDLAGNEEMKSPSELRDAFLPILEKCLKITIHAGETADADSIWEAVYHLSADRIGHGLKLLEREDLMDKIKERKISIELCPSSNKQILDFTDREYPLKKYLDRGLKVTLNTDNLGISRTDFTNEFIIGSDLVNNTLTFWELLQLIKNSFVSAFCKIDTKKDLIIGAEKSVMEIINEEIFK